MRSTTGCLTVDTLLVKVIDEYTGNLAPDLFVPKAWTPNGDGNNDLLFPFPAKIRELKYFRIFNRWGQLMFETNQLMKGWNGIFNGRPQVMDTYSWTAEAIGIDGTVIKRAGNFCLVAINCKIMKTKKIYGALIMAGLAVNATRAQDPSFSQFFASPLNVNPALTANIDGKWRFISNLRNQWVGPASPYATGTVSFDTRLLEKKIPEGSTFGGGAMMMYDKALQGALKSSYFSLDVSYNITLAEENATQRLGIGIGGIYGNKRVDFSKLNFGEQFTGYGFDTNLPTAEAALSNMKPYLSTSVGILYSITTDNSNLEFGAAGFHMNRPKQSVLNDPNQYLAARYVGHANFDTYLNEQLVLNANAIYQRQETPSIFQPEAGSDIF